MDKKYLWMNGTTHETQDPNWDQHEAEKRGLIPPQNSKPLFAVASRSMPRLSKEVEVSLGSLAFEERSYSPD
jgi:hypothetical protein